MEPNDILRGTLDLLILRTLGVEPMHGWGICHWIQLYSKDAFQIGQGSIYPALQRLEERGWIRSEWRQSELQRGAKYYALTRAGQKGLGDATAQWRRYVANVELILRAT